MLAGSNARWVGASRSSLAFVALWVALLRFPILTGFVSTEDGWKSGLGILLQRRAQVGEDWIFTYGPLGYFLQTTYVPGLFAARWIFECAVKAVLALVALGVLRQPASAGLRIAAYAALVCLPASDDGAAYELLILLAGLHLLGGRAERVWIRTGLGLVLGALGLVKFSLLVLAAGTVGIVAVDLLLSGRRQAAATWVATFLAGFALAWTLAGQSIANVPAYLAAAFDLARGYSDAMSKEGPALELAAALAVLGLLLSAMLSGPGLPRGRSDRLRAALLAFALVLAFKEGFTRHDVYHAARYFAFALAAVPLVPFAVAGVRWRAVPRIAILGAAGLVASLALARALRAIPDAPEIWPDPARNLAAGFHGLARPARLHAALEEQLARQRTTRDLGRLRAATGEEPVDVLGNFQIFAQLAGMNWSPRYCFQAYAAFTDATVARNAACLSGDRAPRFLLLDGVVIDRRYPTLEDCGSALRALQGYRPVTGQGGYLLLERTDEVPPTPTRTVRAVLRPGEACDLPDGASPVLARIRCRKTMRGILRGALLQTPEVDLRVELRSGAVASFRALPSLASSTFLLSPMLGSVDDWIEAYTAAGAANAVARFQILERGDGGCFERFEVELEVLPALTGIRITDDAARELHARVRAR